MFSLMRRGLNSAVFVCVQTGLTGSAPQDLKREERRGQMQLWVYFSEKQCRREEEIGGEKKEAVLLNLCGENNGPQT